MPAKHSSRNRLGRKERLELVAEQKLRGLSTREIAARMHVSQSTVVKDLKLIEQNWTERAADVLGLAKGREVSRLELVIREAWDAWERSKQPHERIVARKGAPEKPAKKAEPTEADQELVIVSHTVTTTHSAGNFRFLEVIVTASAQIAQILGLNSAAELNVTVQRYISSVAGELGMTPSALQEEITGVMEMAWLQSWGPSGPS